MRISAGRTGLHRTNQPHASQLVEHAAGGHSVCTPSLVKGQRKGKVELPVASGATHLPVILRIQRHGALLRGGAAVLVGVRRVAAAAGHHLALGVGAVVVGAHTLAQERTALNR